MSEMRMTRSVSAGCASDSGRPVHLSAAEETELLEAMEQIRRGEYVDGDVLLNELRSGLSD